MHKIENVMVKGPYVASPRMTVREALNYMERCDIRHLPVLEGQKLMGIVSERDLIEMPFIDREDIFLEDVMMRSPYVAYQDQSVYSVAKHMAKTKVGSTLIVDDEHHLIGIFTTVDALKLLCEFLEYQEAFERLVPHTIGEYFLAS